MQDKPDDGTFGCPSHLERFRRGHPITGDEGDRCNGYLVIKPRGLKVIFSDGGGWQHLSVTRIASDKTPSYEQLDKLKREFWSPSCCVVQLHVPEEAHVNMHVGCLHLWRPIGGGIPRPWSMMV